MGHKEIKSRANPNFEPFKTQAARDHVLRVQGGLLHAEFDAEPSFGSHEIQRRKS